LLEFQITDSLSNISNSPIINSFDLETEIAQRKIQLEKSKLFPEFNIGYFNQQIDGVEGFKGFEAGMSMNLWFFQQRKNIKSSAIESEIAMNNKEYYVGNLTNQIKLMTEKFKIQNQEIQYFKQTGINSSQIIMKNAKIKFLQGEISYYEYLQALQTASEIQLSYAEKIFELNTTIITLNYLTGKK
jgi:cobalt-zinc-cadmium resistance protein CzcA